jgi:2-iminobutanoate/2-iminopropanoate deaminase
MSESAAVKRLGTALLAGVVSLMWVAAPGALAAQEARERAYIEHLLPPSGAQPPFSDAVREGNTLYVAGHIGIDPKTGNAAAGAETEARLVMEGVKHTLERAGFGMDDLVSVTVYCTDLALYDTFNRVYAEYFHGHHPARAFIGVDKLIRGAHFEIQGTAVKAGQK